MADLGEMLSAHHSRVTTKQVMTVCDGDVCWLAVDDDGVSTVHRASPC